MGYGFQVCDNYQAGLTGWDGWSKSAVSLEGIARAAFHGAVSGAVAGVLSPALGGIGQALGRIPGVGRALSRATGTRLGRMGMTAATEFLIGRAQRVTYNVTTGGLRNWNDDLWNPQSREWRREVALDIVPGVAALGVGSAWRTSKIGQSTRDLFARRAAKRAVVSTLGAEHPELARVLNELIKDTKHRLDLVEALKSPGRRQRTLQFLKEMADGKLLEKQSLAQFLDRHPGSGPLFAKIPDDILYNEMGISRKQAFVNVAKQHDAARTVGANASSTQFALVQDYARRLRNHVEPVVTREVAMLTHLTNQKFGGSAAFSVRTKTAEGLIDKVDRMTTGAGGRRSRSEYEVGDVIDAVGARITVDNVEQLTTLLETVKNHFGTGSRGRILEIENMYASPKAHAPAYRVLPLVITTEANGQLYTFELQLNTRRASIAADLEHNTIFKPIVKTTSHEQNIIRRAMEEAAALEQIERWRP
jgi:ppGpp synthetase/RelA/SpoT-type nucleotidyltranferase